MKYWLVLWRSKGAGGRECVAQTADLNLVRTVIDGLHTNFLIEDDEQDRVLDPAFIRTAPAAAAVLTREIRQAASDDQAASDEWPEAESEEIEGAGTAGNIDSDDSIN